MAIRPVDLQLAYMAAPQNAAVLNAAQESQSAAQQAQAAAFAAEVVRREEQVANTGESQGSKVRARGDRERQQQHPRRRTYLPDPAAEEDAQPGMVLGDGEHFIDVTA
ncbi:MAG TPA: hypothetical protein VFL13_00435 [Candidatus Baltobacteraceae bacterium]|nr:hypothetical protein [Candidatus Baltobacteraceae bacterium]